MKERLIELITKGQPPFNPLNDVCIEKLADFLLENGVIIPPCKVGDRVYDVSEYVYGIPCPEIYEVESDRMTIEKAENGEYLFTYEDAYIRHEDMGKVIFKSREEAEQALKEGAE